MHSRNIFAHEAMIAADSMECVYGSPYTQHVILEAVDALSCRRKMWLYL